MPSLRNYHVAYYDGVSNDATLGEDYAATRTLMKAEIKTAGGFDALTSDDQQVAAMWFLEDDDAKRAAQFEIIVKTTYTVAQSAATLKLNEVKTAQLALDQATTDETTAQAQNDAAVTAASDWDASAVLDALTAATAQLASDEKDLAGAQSDFDTAAAAFAVVDTTPTAFQDLQYQLDVAQAEYSDAPLDLSKKAARDAAQEALDNYVLLRKASLAAKTARNAAQAAVDASQAAWNEANTAVTRLYDRTVSSGEYQAALATAETAELAYGDAARRAAAEPDNSGLQSAADDAKAAHNAAQTALATAAARVTQQKALIAGKLEVEHWATVVSQKTAVVAALQSEADALQATADGLNQTDEEWASLTAAEEAQWSDKYHAQMIDSRQRRVRVITAYLCREFDTLKADDILDPLAGLIDRYERLQHKQSTEAYPHEGLYDYFYSTAGTSFAGDGFAECGYTPKTSGLQLTDMRDVMINTLESGAAAV